MTVSGEVVRVGGKAAGATARPAQREMARLTWPVAALVIGVACAAMWFGIVWLATAMG